MPPTGKVMEDGQCQPILSGRLRTVRLLVSRSLSLVFALVTVSIPGISLSQSSQNLPLILEVPLSAWPRVHHDEVPQSNEYGDAKPWEAWHEQTEDLRGTVSERVSLKSRWVVQVIFFWERYDFFLVFWTYTIAIYFPS